MDRAQIAQIYAMYLSCGLEVGSDDYVYEEGTSKKATGTFCGYWPKFMGIGTSDKIATKIKVTNGQVNKITAFDKNGNITSETEL